MERIFLVGPKHSGKTSAGKILAELCSCEFIDTDDIISRKTGKNPRQLFSEDPLKFQKTEVEVLSELTGSGFTGALCIIATGGGIIDNQEAISLIKNLNAKIVFLDIPASTAWQRIVNSGELPSFLQTENPQETHQTLHERRSAAYSQLADIIIQAEGKTATEVAAEVAAEIAGEIGQRII